MKLKTLFTLIYTIAAYQTVAEVDLQPAADARVYFATNFYRSLIYHMRDEVVAKRSFVISPGALQKLLVVIYEAAEDQLADSMLWDMRLKHSDSRHFGNDIDMWQRQLERLESPIKIETVRNYFAHDFAKMNDKLRIQNYIVAPPKEPNCSTRFQHFAEEYFYTTVLNEDASIVATVQQEFGVYLNNTQNLNIFSGFHLYAQCRQQEFSVSHKGMQAHGHFRYAEIDELADRGFTAKVLELNLSAGEQPLSMLIVLPDTPAYWDTFITQSLGRAVHNLDVICRDLKVEKVNVKLPLLEFETMTNLADYFVEVSTRGLHDLFTQVDKLNGIFENRTKSGAKVENFWQKAVVHVDFVSGPPEYRERNWASMKIFDATEQSFFFVIKREEVLYIMGHHFVG